MAHPAAAGEARDVKVEAGDTQRTLTGLAWEVCFHPPACASLSRSVLSAGMRPGLAVRTDGNDRDGAVACPPRRLRSLDGMRAMVLTCCQLYATARGLVSRATLTAPTRVHRCILMKAPHRGFKLSDWYGQDWDHKKPADDLWVSPWAKAHYKLRQQEIEIEQCEFMMQHAVDTEDYEEADGLKTRVERLRSQHPIIPREERLATALKAGDFGLANVFRNDLESIKMNLGLPKYAVGQAVEHTYREGLRGVIIDVDLQCSKGRDWVHAAGCLERGCALGFPGEETDVDKLKGWVNQPFYVVILDLTDEQLEDEPSERYAYRDATRDEEPDLSRTSGGIGGGGSGGQLEGVGRWKWSWPEELSAWGVNTFSKLPAPLYLPEDALSHETDDSTAISHPELSKLFDGFSTTPHHGREYRPTPRLRLWQQKRTKEEQAARRKRVFNDLRSI